MQRERGRSSGWGHPASVPQRSRLLILFLAPAASFLASPCCFAWHTATSARPHRMLPPATPKATAQGRSRARRSEGHHVAQRLEPSTRRRPTLLAAADAPTASAVEGAKAAQGPLQAFWKFLRPHTIRGTILGSSAMTARAVIENAAPPDWSLLPMAACGVVTLLCGNGFIVGINQIYDVSIDVINKPFLPVAAKELTVFQAWVLCIIMAIGGTALAYGLFGPLIGSLYVFGLSLGVVYSVPPFRWKRSAIAAALIIATVRGFLLNFGVYYAARAMLGVPFSWSSPTAFMTCFGVIFALVIAVTKDLPDVQGDLEGKVDTFATKYGVERVSLIASAVLVANFGQCFLWACGPARAAFRPLILLPSQTIMAAMLVRGWLRLRAAGFTQDALKAFYGLIWIVFYTQYLLFPFI